MAQAIKYQEEFLEEYQGEKMMQATKYLTKQVCFMFDASEWAGCLVELQKVIGLLPAECGGI